MDESQRSPDEPEDERDRARANIVLLVFFVVIVGAGVWLANSLGDHGRMDDCTAQGRRNCAPVDVPPR